jgi:hypothetical protein
MRLRSPFFGKSAVIRQYPGKKSITGRTRTNRIGVLFNTGRYITRMLTATHIIIKARSAGILLKKAE